MERLILFRHGDAERESESGQDFDRRLSPRGVRESEAMGRTLAEMGFSPDLALISTAARTRGTWDAVAALFPGATTQFDDELYLAEAAVIRRCLRTPEGAPRTVLVVGHNPGLQDLTVWLLAEAAAPGGLISKARTQFPTAAAAVFLFDDAGRPASDGLFFPRDRRGG